jgi:hypothetical protein
VSLRATLKAAAKSALAAIGDLKTTCTYTHVDGSPTYTPGTGAVTENSTDVAGVTVTLTEEARMKRNEFGVFRMTVAYIHADQLSIDPRDGDYFVDADGRRWNVAKILANSGVVWELEVQENL